MKIDAATPAFYKPQHAEAAGQRNTALFADTLDNTARRSDAQVGNGRDVDFTDMSRQEISEAGKQLFRAGKITLDELFRFDHPDGKLGIASDGSRVAPSPNDRIDFIAETKKAISDMEQTGDYIRPDSPYKMFVGLLEKLKSA